MHTCVYTCICTQPSTYTCVPVWHSAGWKWSRSTASCGPYTATPSTTSCRSYVLLIILSSLVLIWLLLATLQRRAVPGPGPGPYPMHASTRTRNNFVQESLRINPELQTFYKPLNQIAGDQQSAEQLCAGEPAQGGTLQAAIARANRPSSRRCPGSVLCLNPKP